MASRGRSTEARRVAAMGPVARYEHKMAVDAKQSEIDVITPEMKAKGCYQAENKGRRYYRLQHLDRLHRNGQFTYEQYQAGIWYRDQFDRGRFDRPRTQDLTRPRGENVVDLDMGANEQRARDNWRRARTVWPRDTLGLMEAFLLRDAYPKQHHRARARLLDDLRRGLSAMAAHLGYVSLDSGTFRVHN